MTTEEKAKRYDEVINRMKHYVVDEYGCSRIKVADVFPELKESEDARIRKRISQALHGDVLDMDEIAKADAWLEKQDKNNMGISEDIKKKLYDKLNKALEKETPESWNEFLDKQGEHEYALKSSNTEDVYRLMEKITKLAEAYELNLPNRSYDIYAFAKDILAWFENQGEQKHAWSEEDESYLSHVITAINSYYTDDIDSDGKGCENPWREELIRWLKSIKQTLKDES